MLKFIKENKGKIGGGIIGLLLAILLIIAWPIILILFLIFLGIILGAVFDMASKTRRWMEKQFFQNTDKDQRKEN